MTFSISIRRYWLITLLIFLFSFSGSLVNAKTFSQNSSCDLNLGLSACRVNSLSQQKGVKGLLGFYNDKFALTGGMIQTPDEVTAKLKEQLDQLTLTLASIKLAVQNSKTMTEIEKQIFFKQIEIIELQIKQLRKSLDLKSDMHSSDFSVPTPPVPEAEKKSAKDAKLDSILVTFNNDNDEAKVVLKYKNGPKTLKLTLEAVTEVSEFYSKMKVLKEGLIIELSNSEKVFADDIKALIRISARNPVRDNAIAANSVTAQKLYENFALQSIINKIVIRPGSTAEGFNPSLYMSTDQDEALEVKLNLDELDRFDAVVQYYATTPFDKVDYDDKGNKIFYPKYTEYALDIAKEDIVELIQDYYDDLPFSRKISNFGKIFTTFVVDNQNHYETSLPDVPDFLRDCYQSSDKAVFNEFSNFFLNGILFQTEPTDGISTYISWTKSNPDYPSSESCVMWPPYF